MKNWKTTLLGLAGGIPFAVQALMEAYTAGFFTEKSGWQLIIAILFTIFMAIIKDPSKKDIQKFSEDGDGKVNPDKPPFA